MGKQILSTLLCGIAQIAFMNRPIAGGVFLLSVALISPFSVLSCLAGTLISTGVAIAAKCPPDKVREGLYGFNGALLGLALPVFLPHDWLLWLYLGIGSILTVFLYGWISSHLRLPSLTMPYVLIAWVIIAISGGVQPAESLPGELKVTIAAWLGLGQIFFAESILSGMVILIGIALVSFRSAIWACGASWIGVLPALWLQGQYSVSAGLISLNTSLCAIGYLQLKMGKNQFPPILLALFAAVSYPIFEYTLSFFPLPVLTFPFIFTIWMGYGFSSIFSKLQKKQFDIFMN